LDLAWPPVGAVAHDGVHVLLRGPLDADAVGHRWSWVHHAACHAILVGFDLVRLKDIDVIVVGQESNHFAPRFSILDCLHGRYSIESLDEVGVTTVEICILVAMGQHDPHRAGHAAESC
jgi:hypothetical protein